ncbi:12925_t:CDS:1, partial [Ambispora leptoticha]
PKISYAIPKSWKDLMEKYWHQDPEKRPDVNKLYTLVRRIRNRGSAWINKDIDKDELAASTRELNKTDIRKQNLHPGAIYTSRLVPCLSNTSTVHSDDDLFAS